MQARASAKAVGERFLLHNSIVGGSTLVAGLLGISFQALVSHRFRPSEFAGVFSVMTLLTLVSVPAAALTLLMARQTSRDRASGNYAESTALLRDGNVALLAAGVVLALVVAGLSQWVAGFVNAPRGLVIAAAVSLPATLSLPLVLGELQGQQHFSFYSLLVAGQAALKLVAAIALGITFGAVGVVAGLAIASTAMYAVACFLVRGKLSSRASAHWLPPALRYLSLLLPSTVALAILLSADVLLANHFFPKATAGEYGAVAALGRGIFWGAAGVATVLFPKVIFQEARGSNGNRLVTLSIALVVLGGVGGLLLLTVMARSVLSAFSGEAYAAGASYLAGYAIAMTLLGCASVLIATHQSRGHPTFLAVLVPIAIAEPIAIVALHRDPAQVVQVLIASLTLLVAGLVVILIRDGSVTAKRSSIVLAGVLSAEVKA